MTETSDSVTKPARAGAPLDLLFLPPVWQYRIRRMAAFGLGLSLLVITVASLLPGDIGDLGAMGINDKSAHLAAYAGAMACAMMSTTSSAPRMKWGFFLMAYGVAMEAFQAAMGQGREASLGDMAANIAGVGLGALAALLTAHIASRAFQGRSVS